MQKVNFGSTLGTSFTVENAQAIGADVLRFCVGNCYQSEFDM